MACECRAPLPTGTMTRSLYTDGQRHGDDAWLGRAAAGGGANFRSGGATSSGGRGDLC